MSRVDELRSHLDVLRLWSGPSALAQDVGQEPVVVRQWFHRRRIPARHWLPVVRAARGLGADVSVELLAEMNADQVEAA